METFRRFVKEFFDSFQLRVAATVAVLLAGTMLVAADAWSRTPCSLDKPGACFEPVENDFVGAIVDAEMQGVVVIIPVSPDSNFEQILPNGTRRLHQNVTGVPLFYCPNVVGPDCVVAPLMGEGRVNAEINTWFASTTATSNRQG